MISNILLSAACGVGNLLGHQSYKTNLISNNYSDNHILRCKCGGETLLSPVTYDTGKRINDRTVIGSTCMAVRTFMMVFPKIKSDFPTARVNA